MAYTLPASEQMDMEGLELGVRYLNVNGDTVTATAAETNAAGTYVAALTATALEVNTAADVGGRNKFHGDITAYPFTVAESGTTHIISAWAADATFTLPLAFAGGQYSLLMGGDVAEAQNLLVTTTSDELFAGGLGFLDEDAGAADGVDTVLPTASADLLTVVTPQPPTRLDFYSDGTKWYVSGIVWSATIPTFTTP